MECFSDGSRVLECFAVLLRSLTVVIEQRRLELLADFDGIAKREKELAEELAKAKGERKALKRKVQEDEGPNPQILLRKYLKIKDFQHVSRILVCSPLYSLLSSCTRGLMYQRS